MLRFTYVTICNESYTFSNGGEMKAINCNKCKKPIKSKVKNYSDNDFQTAVSFSELNKKGRVS